MIFFLSLNMGEGKEAYKVLQAGVLLEILPPLTRCHTGHPPSLLSNNSRVSPQHSLHLGVLLRLLSAFS